MKNIMKKKAWLLIITSIIILLPMAFGFAVWNKLPEQMAIHWNASGEVDGFGSPILAVVLLPVVLLTVHWVCIFLSFTDKKSHDEVAKALGFVLWFIPAISVYSNVIVYTTVFGLELNLYAILSIFFGILFVVVGNYMPKFSRNRRVGIKIYWTLANDENWHKTHRLAAKVWVIGGALIMLCAFLPESIAMYALPALFALMMAIPVIYSGVYYSKQKKTVGKANDGKMSLGKGGPVAAVIIVVLIATVLGIVTFIGNIGVEVGETELSVSATYSMGVTVKYEDVTEMEYREGGLVSGSKIYGFNSPRLLLGTFSNEELGTYTRYTYASSKDCIILSTKGGAIVVGCDTAEETRALYDALVAKGVSVKGDAQ